MLIQKYSKKWVENFELLKSFFIKNINENCISIEHIGSTAVPNLDAKPIIDIDIVYFNLNDFQNIKNQLEKLGYYHNGNQGIKDREVFKKMKTKNISMLDSIPHHLYVCFHESQELKRHLGFRDYLRKNKIARKEYQELKYTIAQEANQDKKTYAQLKEIRAKDFILSIIKLSKEKDSQ